MPKIGRKRKSSIKLEKQINTRKKGIKMNDECEKEDLAEINNNIEIIKLSESIFDSDEDDDCNWEEVSELDDKMDIIVNLNDEDFDSASEKANKKRDHQKNHREKQEFIHRTALMALTGRVLFINGLCDDPLIKGVALSCLPSISSKQKSWNNKSLHSFIIELKKQFNVENDDDESGIVRDILTEAFHTKHVRSAWINVVLVALLRSAGIDTRLVAAIYPGPLKSSAARQNASDLFCPPPKSKITENEVLHKRRMSTLFTIEVLDDDTLQWIAVNACNLTDWDDPDAVVKEHPRFLYCIAVRSRNRVKDVSPKYDTTWATVSRRQRLSEPSLSRILSPLRGPIRDDDRIEEAAIRDRLIAQGVPTTLADVKGHPLFVLRRHMLKYEVLYPHDVAPFGELRDEPVFLRTDVRVAHTKETWLKEAMVVKSDEIPCKKVKTIASRRKNNEKGSDPFVDLFGPWQVEPYTPPTAVDGVVPRNVYGNVDLFLPSMLPGGCSHLHLRELDKVANQLDIDCVPAMVGWAFTKRTIARPVHDGWIVCTESVDILKSAWREFQMDKQAKHAEKRRKVVINRWAVFTRKLLLKERLRLEYNF